MDKKLIYKTVLKLGGGVERKGFEYIVSAVEKLYYNPKLRTTLLYKLIAEENDENASRVERSIRYYVHKLMREGSYTEINKLSMKLHNGVTPTNTEFLKSIVLYLKLTHSL